LAALGTTIGSYAATPSTTSYQGILTDSKGNAVNGSHSVTFSLYTAAEGGSAVWSETKAVTVNNGLCATDLGSVKPLTDGIWSNPGLWLGVKVGSGIEMKPRTKILAVPYALRAKVAESVIGGSGSGLGALPVGTVLESTNPDDTVLKSAGFINQEAKDLTSKVVELTNPFPGTAPGSLEVPYRLAATESKLLAFKFGSDSTPTQGKIYDVSEKKWSDINMKNAPSMYADSFEAYSAGDNYLLYASGQNLSMYNCVTNSWSSVSTNNAPKGSIQTTHWTGVKLVVLGDNQDICVYNPKDNSWETSIIRDNAPSFSDDATINSVRVGNKILFYEEIINNSFSIKFADYSLYFYDIDSSTWTVKKLPSTLGIPENGTVNRIHSFKNHNDFRFLLALRVDSSFVFSKKVIDLKSSDFTWLVPTESCFPPHSKGLIIGNKLVVSPEYIDGEYEVYDSVSGISVDIKGGAFPVDKPLYGSYGDFYPVKIGATAYSNDVNGRLLEWSASNCKAIYRYVKQP